MDQVGLRYSTSHKILICLQHGYSLLPKGIEQHLRKLHKIKGVILHAVLEETSLLLLQLPGFASIPPPNQPPIAGLTIHHGFQCQLPACNQDSGAISINYEFVRRHQARSHGVNLRQRKKQLGENPSNSQDIATVCIQSLFPAPHYHPFIVQNEASHATIPILSTAEEDSTQSQLMQNYQESKEAEQTVIESIPIQEHKAQLPPWINHTGIFQRLSGLNRILCLQLIDSAQPSMSLFSSLNHFNHINLFPYRRTHFGLC